MINPQKLLLVGLDFAGKTSILRVLTQNYSSMEKTKPTIGIEREIIKILGADIIIWDLGGQEKYRTEYLNDMRVFAKTQTLYFVVDILSPRTYELALQYFTTILIMIESLGIKPQINLCLHKVDPDLQNNPKTQQQVQKARKLFLSNSRGFEISVFNTSIYDTKSIVRAFTKAFHELITTLQPLKKIVQTVVAQLELDGAMLFDENLMLLSEFYKSEVCKELCLNVVYESVRDLHEVDSTSSAEKFGETFESHINLKSKKQRFRVFPLKIKDWNLYLLTVGKEVVDVQLVYDSFSSMI